jgi:serine protease Do
VKKNILFFVAILLVGVFSGLIISSKTDIFSRAQGQNANAAQNKNIEPAVAPGSFEGFRMEDAIINVANIAGKAVVSISSEHTAKFKGSRRYYYSYPFGGGSPFGDNDSLRKFFDDFFGDMPDREYKQVGLGSGVIVDPAGYILTNQHVIDQADKITVTLPDGREFKGEVKGEDERSDLAIVKINARNLPVAVLGDSDNLRIGQWVVAIGNPFGFALQNAEPTVTVGVIGALHRSLGRALSRERDYSDLIQTDAAINPGNSGGPLVNLKGEVVGINVAIFSTTGGYEGIGFAIPINNAKRIISRLIEGKKIIYGWLGITVQDLTQDMAQYFGLPDKNGVLVAKVVENSPAQKAGIKASDIIKQFDNKPINNTRELLNAVGKAAVGSSVKITVIRDKKELALAVEIGERPKDVEKASREISAPDRWRGLSVQDLTPDVVRSFNIQEKKGVVVVEVEPDSPADDAGIIPGDVIIEINKAKIDNLSDYNRITQDLKGNVLLRTERGYFLVKTGEQR